MFTSYTHQAWVMKYNSVMFPSFSSSNRGGSRHDLTWKLDLKKFLPEEYDIQDSHYEQRTKKKLAIVSYF